MSEIRLVAMQMADGGLIPAESVSEDADDHDAWRAGITEAEIGPVRELIRYRVTPEAVRYGDWSVPLKRKLDSAFTPTQPNPEEELND